LFLAIPFAFLWQSIVIFPQLSVSHPYSDALIYTDLAQGKLDFFGPTHITHRVTVPGLAGLVHTFTTLPIQWAFAILNLAILVIVLWRVYRDKDGLVWAFFSLLTLLLPTFWRGFFLPMTDTFLWAFLTLFWLEAEKNKPNPIALFLLFSVALFSKEIAFLVIPFVLLSDVKQKKIVLFAVVFPLLTWLLIESFYVGKTGTSYLFQPDLWWRDITKNLSWKLVWLPKYLLSGFAGLLVAFAYRWFITGKKYIREIAPELVIFLIILMIAPENSPRILFSFSGIVILRFIR
jgi:hypothetical protein